LTNSRAGVIINFVEQIDKAGKMIMDKSSITFKTKNEIILEDIRRDILDGAYKIGEKLATEHKLSEIYGANRGTINKVLFALEHEGLITRKTSVGSTVLDIKDRKATLRLAAMIMISKGHMFAELYSYMFQAIQRNHYFPVLIDIPIGTSHDAIIEAIGGHLKDLVESSPDFFLVDGMFDFPFEFLKEISPDIRNLIFFNRVETNIPFSASYVLSDYEKGGYLGAKHLFDVGCENIVFACSSLKKTRISYDVLNGIQKVFLENGTRFGSENIFVLDRKGNLEALLHKFRRKKHPDGIFVFSDSLARKIQRELGKFNLVPGRDYKMVGYFNTPWAYEFEPTLTSISINQKTIAEKFSQLLLHREFRENKKIIVEPELIRRETT